MAEGVCGYLVPPERPDALAESIARVLADPSRAAVLGAQGRERVVARFSFAAQALAYQALFARLLGGTIGPAAPGATPEDITPAQGV